MQLNIPHNMTSNAWLHFGIPSSLSWLIDKPILEFLGYGLLEKSWQSAGVFIPKDS